MKLTDYLYKWTNAATPGFLGLRKTVKGLFHLTLLDNPGVERKDVEGKLFLVLCSKSQPPRKSRARDKQE